MEATRKNLYSTICPSGVMTLTGSASGENGKGMEILGNPNERGYTFEEMRKCMNLFEDAGYTCEFIHLHEKLPLSIRDEAEKAYVLVVRNGVSLLTDPDELFEELLKKSWDRKKWIRGSVKNSIARWNTMFVAGKTQEPDYGAKKGSVHDIDEISQLSEVQKKLRNLLGKKADNLLFEGNLYYDPSKCGIGFHGDGERKCVAALRLGGTMPLVFEWFRWSKPVGARVEISLNHGDFYVMSEKAVGCDWLKKKKLTLRHAAGCSKYTVPKVRSSSGKKRKFSGKEKNEGNEQKKIC